MKAIDNITIDQARSICLRLMQTSINDLSDAQIKTLARTYLYNQSPRLSPKEVLAKSVAEYSRKK